MITLGTGLPGNGKTLFMLWYLQAKAKKENREVYYHNVKDLNVDVVGPWQTFEPDKWMELPYGAIILIDECQEVFPRKPNGSQLPKHYEELAKHRHKGFDIFLITQHPTLIDNFVRRLVGQHFHSVRKFGLQRATVYEWSSCNPAPETPASQKSAVPLKWSYPKEVFGWYKSAEVHTVKRSIPAKLILAVLFVIAVLATGYYALDRYQHRYDKVKPNNAAVAGVVGAPGGAVLSAGFAPPVAAHVPVDPVADMKDYVFRETPRVAGVPQTAPKYDALTVPTRVPVPAMCVQLGVAREGQEVRCKCWTQQGTVMEGFPFNMCIQFARNGIFRDFDADRDRAIADRSDPGKLVAPDQSGAVSERRVAVAGPSVVIPNMDIQMAKPASVLGK